MTDTQHTPGPWFVTPDNYAVYDDDQYGYRSDTVCVLSGYGSNNRLRAANARLIAAAPELLVALLDVLYCVEFPNSQHKAQVDAAKAAIAKATGGAN